MLKIREARAFQVHGFLIPLAEVANRGLKAASFQFWAEPEKTLGSWDTSHAIAET